ncbi:hypothetical protein OSH11_05415 [Kaistia dalseonensis]|uniref:Uncharacterized protein n=1 Tax=Kaistia dalseonensis TaxID=410840 RepID=A0ABU0H5H7_9HYPH|nr:hypothetical protein [Kaistia dalseonensis]MCX5494127.1 hypothetical protein [Kaistia dalseonensis]MDQ0436706.1 hypothetical protein [Kaistia dalseonensis]
MAQFHESLSAPKPPASLSAALAALWHLERGDWDQAHALAQDDHSRAGAWVHAHLHRVEGDDWNARYWYGRAGKPEGRGEFGVERTAMIRTLLAGE